jgi:glycosyltransferase involved in cell wall biosynthesis
VTASPARHVLIVTAYVPPTGGGGTIRVAKLVRYLAPLGWAADLVGWADAPAIFDDPTILGDLSPGTGVMRVSTPLRRLEARLGASARRGPGPVTRRFRVLSEARSAVHAVTAVPDAWIGWALRVAASPVSRLAPSGHPDAVLTSGPPHAAHVAGLFLSRRLGVPLLMDLRDEWASLPLFRSRFAGRRRIDEAIEAACVRHAAAVVTVSDVSAERCRARYPGRRSRIHTIANGFDPADFERLPPPPSSGPPFLLGHIGSLHAPRDIRPLLDAVRRLRHSGDLPPVRLMLAGDVDRDQLDAARAILGDALDAPGHISHTEALRVMSACHVLVLVSDRIEADPAA